MSDTPPPYGPPPDGLQVVRRGAGWSRAGVPGLRPFSAHAGVPAADAASEKQVEEVRARA